LRTTSAPRWPTICENGRRPSRLRDVFLRTGEPVSGLGDDFLAGNDEQIFTGVGFPHTVGVRGVVLRDADEGKPDITGCRRKLLRR
jgi:hypothetical protein